MIRVFGPAETTYQSNGDVVLQPVRAEVFCAENGDYYLDITTDTSYVDYLVHGNILVADTPEGPQPFRIYNPTVTAHKITARCWHVYYDSENYLIEDSRAVDMNANNALLHFKAATEPALPFTVNSDVPDVINTAYIIRKSFRQAVQVVLERWGGHIVRNGWTISVKESIGNDNGVTIRYGKNQKEITKEEDWSSVVTKLMPVGYDGIMLPEVYLTSETQYAIPYTKTVSFSQNLDPEEFVDEDGNVDEDAYKAALVEDLRTQAGAYLEQNCVPRVNYTLRANVEKMTGLGDTIEVIDERLGINLLTNVIAYRYDLILKKYREIEFGNFRKSISGLLSKIQLETNEAVQNANTETKAILQSELESATSQILGVLGNSYVIYDGDKILVVDTLPKETATNVIRINSGGIGFSTNGINGPFNSAWKIDGTFDAQAANVINLSADAITSGTLRLGNQDNQSGILMVYDENGTQIAQLDKDGLTVYATDRTFVRINGADGFAGYQYDENGVPQKIYWADGEQFHMSQAFVENEITLAYRMRFIPITVDDGNGNVINDGIGLVSVYEGGE